MGLFGKIKKWFNYKKGKTSEIVEIPITNTKVIEKQKYINTYIDFWQYIKPKENTQAQHILSVLSTDEWLNMDNIREKIKNMFFIEYKHEKSLYPYIKTLVDVGLLETSSVGGKRKWKKRHISISNGHILESIEE